jgi:hypothetical protein
MRRAYQSDLSDAEWGCLEPHLPAPETEELREAFIYAAMSRLMARRLARS